MNHTKTGFANDEVNDVELELTGFCNLKCPLCANRYSFISDAIKRKNIRPLNEWISQLNKYINLRSVCLAGIVSEPTLYPYLFELLDYFHSRCITVELYSNANTHDEQWWNQLNRHMHEDDKVFFTICGSTQELHSKYRVGSNLQQILNHAAAFKRGNKYENDWIQHIKFNYNVEDFEKNMKSIISMFSHSFLINSLPYKERFDVKSNICMPYNLSNKYLAIMKYAIDQRAKNKKFKVCCKSLETNFLALDQFGNEFPCFLYRFYSNQKFDHEDYSDILNYKYDFCFECEKLTKSLLEMNKMERMA